MNNNINFCPKCKGTKNIKITIEYPTVHTKCICGYNQIVPISSYITSINENLDSTTTLGNSDFPDIRQNISLGFDHINKYFSSLKLEIITLLMRQINTIEAAYENCYTKNNLILTLLQTLIKNYNGSLIIEDTINNSNISIYKCKDSKSLTEVIQYFNNYNIINPSDDKRINDKLKKKNIDKLDSYINELENLKTKGNTTKNEKTETIQPPIKSEIKPIKAININTFQNIKTITLHTNTVESLLLLKDNKIASCSVDNTLKIYDPLKEYEKDRSYEYNASVLSICQLEDGTLVAALQSKAIIIGDLFILNAHDNKISKVITLPNNRIASSSYDKTIKIWASDLVYSTSPIAILEGHKYIIEAIIYIKEKDLLISGSPKGLYMWDMTEYKVKSKIDNLSCSGANALYQLDDERILIGACDEIQIVNFCNNSIEKTIKDVQLGIVRCFMKMRDNKTILCGCCGGKFCLFNKNTKQYIVSKNKHLNDITDLLSINSDTFMSCSLDYSIKVWKY